jgi:NAD(P)-dependent dehydrogenase (short-subunit alcohol dehydrogenase family)
MSTDDYYQDKICIVTGANSGIGYALSEELLHRGATVYMAGRSPEKVAKAAERLAAYKDRVHTVVVDVTKQEQVQKAIEDTAAQAGRLDILFNIFSTLSRLSWSLYEKFAPLWGGITLSRCIALGDCIFPARDH